MHYAIFVEFDSISFNEAIDDPKYVNAMKEGLNIIEKNQTWELVSLPHDKKLIVLKGICKVKVNPNGEVIKHKARLVVKGFLQKLGVDYGEVYAHAAKTKIVRLVVAITNI